MSSRPPYGHRMKVPRKKGVSWRAKIEISGTTYRKTFRTAGEADDWLHQKSREKIEVESGLRPPEPEEQVTVARAAEKLMRHFEAGTERVLRESTLRGYRLDLRQLVERFGDRTVASLRTSDARQWAADMREAGLSTGTIKHRLDRLSQLIEYCLSEELISHSLCQVKRPRAKQRSEPDALPEEQYERLVRAAEADGDPRVLAVILLAGDAGLRRGEIFALRGDDVWLDSGARGVIRVPVLDEESQPKSGRARTVPILTDRLRRALKRCWLEVGQPVIREAASPNTISSLGARAWREAMGVPDVPRRDRRGGTRKSRACQLHRLRHRFGTALAETTRASLAQIRDWMGHESATTTDRYLHKRSPDVPKGLAEEFSAGSGQADFRPILDLSANSEGEQSKQDQ